MSSKADPTLGLETARTMEAQAEKVDATMRSLMGQLCALPDACKGSAATTFLAAQTAWEEKSRAHRTTLNGIAETLRVAAKNQVPWKSPTSSPLASTSLPSRPDSADSSTTPQVAT